MTIGVKKNNTFLIRRYPNFSKEEAFENQQLLLFSPQTEIVNKSLSLNFWKKIINLQNLLHKNNRQMRC